VRPYRWPSPKSELNSADSGHAVSPFADLNGGWEALTAPPWSLETELRCDLPDTRIGCMLREALDNALATRLDSLIGKADTYTALRLADLIVKARDAETSLVDGTAPKV
jgi:hypothetical protein